MNTILKRFQQDLVESAKSVLSHYLNELKRVEDYPELIEQLKAQDSALLLEAPTGTGKTLMAGNIAEKLALQDVVWFWFAPFSGITQQTEGAIRAEFKGLRVRDLSQDRHADRVQAGDVYVATWALIANNSTNIHQATETLPSLEDFISQIRARDLHIGVVVDEAHHTFSSQNKAFEAYRNILAPDLTILVTATPNDNDIDRFRRTVGLQYLHRLSVSRERGVEAHLLKRGVRVAIFRANQYSQVLNYRKTALQMAVRHHNALKQLLNNIGLTTIPLLLVQVDSSEGSIAEAEGWLKSMGFADSQVRKHTADEPNPALLADATDDGVEVLLFKMAVATGFDAPRAFTLCSMRATRDPDFGVQIVGRIMRVDRRLQPHLDLPEELEYGYVFLADESSQEGLLGAAKRINQMRDKYGELTSNVVVFTDLPEPMVAQVVNNQPMFFVPNPTPLLQQNESEPTDLTTPSLAPEQPMLFNFTTKKDQKIYGNISVIPVPTETTSEDFIYHLRNDLGFPRKFKRAVVSLDQESILDDLVAQFPYDEVIEDARRDFVEVVMRSLEIFENRALESKKVRGLLTQRDLSLLAQKTLFNMRNGSLDPTLVEEALRKGLHRVFERNGWMEADDPEKIVEGLQKILALNPGKLERTISAVVSKFTLSEQADSVPEHIISKIELPPSFKNIYGRMPSDLNRWEQAFAEVLDDEETVSWWHRNPDRKSYSVGIPITGYSPKQNNFYPDFIVGIRGRVKGEHEVLLVEVKGEYNNARGDSVEKAQAQHPDYGNVLMLYWEQEREWKVVQYNYGKMQNELIRDFDPAQMKNF